MLRYIAFHNLPTSEHQIWVHTPSHDFEALRTNSRVENRCAEFRDEINGLKDNLIRLQRELQISSRIAENSSRVVEFEIDEAFSSNVQDTFQRAYSTIKECRQLFKPPRKVNPTWLKWHMNFNIRMNELRGRISADIASIGPIVKTIELRILQVIQG